MEGALEGRDVLAVMPTSYGKSAIYQLAVAIVDGPTVVVSPLIALQRDQVDSLAGDDVGDAAQANSTVPPSERRDAFDRLRQGDLEFLFLAPEQLAKDDTIAALAEAASLCSSSTRPTASARGGTTSAPTTCVSAR